MTAFLRNILAILLLWRLFDLFKADGAWKRDLADPELDVARTGPPVSSDEVGGTCE